MPLIRMMSTPTREGSGPGGKSAGKYLLHYHFLAMMAWV